MTAMLQPIDHSNTQLLVSEFFRVKRHIDAALEYAKDTHEPKDILHGVQQGYFQFFPLEKSAIVTEIIDYPKITSCRFFLAGGDLIELRDAERQVCDWAKTVGCRRVEIAGRPGWERALHGYDKAAVWLSKELGDE